MKDRGGRVANPVLQVGHPIAVFVDDLAIPDDGQRAARSVWPVPFREAFIHPRGGGGEGKAIGGHRGVDSLCRADAGHHQQQTEEKEAWSHAYPKTKAEKHGSGSTFIRSPKAGTLSRPLA
jgi:hypothetical protein